MRSSPDVFGSFGSFGRVLEEVDWAASSLGPPSGWSDTLLGAVDLMLHTRFPVTLLWGPDFTLVYNEAYVPLIADKHPDALGRPAEAVFSEAWDLIGPMLSAVRDGEGATWVEDAYIPLHRRGFLEECYFTFSYSPVRGRSGAVEGVMDIAAETTEQVVSRRRLNLLRRLTERLVDVRRPEEVAGEALPLLRAEARDFPEVSIVTETGLRHVDGLQVDRRTVRLSISSPEDPQQSVLIMTLSPELAVDEQYLGFVRLVAASLHQALDRVRVRGVEMRLAETQRTMSTAFQRSLLPAPDVSGPVDVAVRYQPAQELAQVGGDWYDVFELPDDSRIVVIGDVAGHDQQAAAAMAQVRNLLRGVAFTLHPATPAEILRGLDRVMCRTAPDVAATVVLMHVTPREDDTLVLEWSNAGHPPPVLVGSDGTSRLLDTEPDLLLGLDDGTVRANHLLTLEPGATVVLYTDGLIERRGMPIADGLTWVVEALSQRHGLDVDAICDSLLVTADTGEDDVALLVLRAGRSPGPR